MWVNDLNEITLAINSEFGSLNNIQLNWKSGEKSWSIGQIIDHMIVSNRKYFPALRKAFSKEYKPSFWEKFNPLTRSTGKQMIGNLGPHSKQKYLTAKLFRPTKGMITENVIQSFQKMQEELLDIISQIDDTTKVRIVTSPVANLVTLKVEDVISIITEHEKRHLQQAREIRGMAQFPT
jgi:hypothetical protein